MVCDLGLKLQILVSILELVLNTDALALYNHMLFVMY